MRPRRAMFLFFLMAITQTQPARAELELTHEDCTSKGYDSQVSCIVQNCGKFATASRAQEKCEEEFNDLCAMVGIEREKSCRGIQ